MEIINYTVEHPSKKTVSLACPMSDTIRNVLKRACEKLNYPPGEYEIRYDGRTLDLETKLDTSDIPASSVLKLSPRTKDKPSILVEFIFDNKANAKRFSASATLWEVSKELFPKEKFIEDDRIQISCFGRRFIGKDNLKRVCLSSLPNGAGKLKLMVERRYSAENLDKVVLKMEKEKDGERKSKLNLNQTINKLPVKNGSKRFNEDATKKHTSTNKILKFKKNFRPNNVLTTVDKSSYMNGNEKMKGIQNLDERKGFIYSLRDLTFLQQESLNLLGIAEDGTKNLSGEEKEIPLKIVFPDLTVIQATFRRKESFEEIKIFLSTVLKCRPSDFSISTIPDIGLKRKLESLGVNDPEKILYIKFIRNSMNTLPSKIFTEKKTPNVSFGERKIWRIK